MRNPTRRSEKSNLGGLGRMHDGAIQLVQGGTLMIGLGELSVSREYLKQYLHWVWCYATEGIPEGLHPQGEFGVVSAEGTLRVIVPLLDEAGQWAASGIGPPCYFGGWIAGPLIVH